MHLIVFLALAYSKPEKVCDAYFKKRLQNYLNKKFFLMLCYAYNRFNKQQKRFLELPSPAS